MENKTTTELLDLLKSLVDKDGNLDDKWSDVYDELKTREPFNLILSNSENEETLEDRIDDLEAEVKKLTRHKHDSKTNDVMIRI